MLGRMGAVGRLLGLGLAASCLEARELKQTAAPVCEEAVSCTSRAGDDGTPTETDAGDPTATRGESASTSNSQETRVGDAGEDSRTSLGAVDVIRPQAMADAGPPLAFPAPVDSRSGKGDGQSDASEPKGASDASVLSGTSSDALDASTSRAPADAAAQEPPLLTAGEECQADEDCSSSYCVANRESSGRLCCDAPCAGNEHCGAAGSCENNETTPEVAATQDDAGSAADAERWVPIFADGVIPPGSNHNGFDGSWYCYTDASGNATSCGATVRDAPELRDGEVCLTGETTIREPGDYDNWGAAIEVSLNQGAAFDAEAAGIQGFSFTVSGDMDGATLLLLIPRTGKSADGPPEIEAQIGAQAVRFTDLEGPTWGESPGEGADPKNIYTLSWRVVGGASESSYRFCVSDVRPF